MSESDLNFKKLHKAENYLREDWSGVWLIIIPYILCACFKKPEFMSYACMHAEECSWITARIIFCLGEGEGE